MGTKKYEHLFKPLDVGRVRLQNRIVMGSIHTGLEEHRDLEALAAFYRERVQGQVGLIVTGGIAPNRTGLLALGGSWMGAKDVIRHQKVTQAVHEAGETKIVMQILHSGRYAFHPFGMSPSGGQSPLSPFRSWKIPGFAMEKLINSFATAAQRAMESGYDGVEIMGSEGYLINEFLAPKTNHRFDRWGGDARKRMKLALEIVKKVRQTCPRPFLIIFRLSLLDLVPEGSVWADVIDLAKDLTKEGVDLLSSGFGWHESRIPTIAGPVPHGAFAPFISKLKAAVSVPVIGSNRVHMPHLAEQFLANKVCDLVSMARPFLADPHWPKKAMEGEEALINTCIACNQACLDHVFSGKIASCLVNPRAGKEIVSRNLTPKKKKILVIGAGPGGLSCAVTAGERGHEVTIVEERDKIGGQLLMAQRIPGKEDFQETLRYFEQKLHRHSVDLRLKTFIDLNFLREHPWDAIVVATGVRPHWPEISGLVPSQNVLSYVDLLLHDQPVGDKVGVIGAGGIGCDVALYLASSPKVKDPLGSFYRRWGVDPTGLAPGGVRPPVLPRPMRQVDLLQRSHEKVGRNFGKTTGWIYRAEIKAHGVRIRSGIHYEKWDGKCLEGTYEGKQFSWEFDTLIVCAGQEAFMPFSLPSDLPWKVIGGAKYTAGLDAKIAIRDGYNLGESF